MAASSRKALGRRLGVLVAGAVVATSLTAASAVVATSAPIGMQATGPTRPGADASPDRRAGTPPPGFLLERGRFATVHVPEAKSTQVQGINNRGQIVGKYSNTSNAVSENGALIRGFLLDRGRYVRLDFPGAVTSQAFDINDRGQADGLSRLGAGDSGSGTGPRSPFPAFLLDRGRYTAFEAPRPGVELYPLGINDRGQIVGNYQNPNATPSRQRTGAPPPRGMEETPS